MTYTVIGFYFDEEIALAEGEYYQDTVNEAVEQIPEIYPKEDVMLKIRKEGHCAQIEMPLEMWLEFNA